MTGALYSALTRLRVSEGMGPGEITEACERMVEVVFATPPEAGRRHIERLDAICGLAFGAAACEGPPGPAGGAHITPAGDALDSDSFHCASHPDPSRGPSDRHRRPGHLLCSEAEFRLICFHLRGQAPPSPEGTSP